MDVGKLRNLVLIQRRAGGKDAAGQKAGAWQTFAQVWADVRHVAGLEAVRADVETSLVKASIRIRYRTDVSATMRVQVGATPYDIKAVLPDAARQFLDLACEAGASNG